MSMRIDRGEEGEEAGEKGGGGKRGSAVWGRNQLGICFLVWDLLYSWVLEPYEPLRAGFNLDSRFPAVAEGVREDKRSSSKSPRLCAS